MTFSTDLFHRRSRTFMSPVQRGAACRGGCVCWCRKQRDAQQAGQTGLFRIFMRIHLLQMNRSAAFTSPGESPAEFLPTREFCLPRLLPPGSLSRPTVKMDQDHRAPVRTCHLLTLGDRSQVAFCRSPEQHLAQACSVKFFRHLHRLLGERFVSACPVSMLERQ